MTAAARAVAPATRARAPARTPPNRPVPPRLPVPMLVGPVSGVAARSVRRAAASPAREASPLPAPPMSLPCLPTCPASRTPLRTRTVSPQSPSSHSPAGR